MTDAAPSFSRSDLEIICDLRATPAQKLILVMLTLCPEGLSLYQIMDMINQPKPNRRSIQRRLEWPLAKGWITREEIERCHVYRRGTIDPSNR